MSYRDDVRTARDRFEGAVEDAAAEALRLAEEYGKPLQTVCKDIAGNEAWRALEAKARRLKRSPESRTRDGHQANIRVVRAMAKADPEAVAREIAKVNPQALIEAATEAQGRTRTSAPSNQAKVEQAFGPQEFNRLEDAIAAVMERLPDLAPNRDDKAYARELAAQAEGVAGTLRAWADGRSIGQEVEAWLEAQ
jgi:hypothetical protein